MHSKRYSPQRSYAYVCYVPQCMVQKKPAGPETVRAGIAILWFVVLTKNQWRCGFVHIFIMHIIVFWRNYSGELKIHCFFQWILCFCSLKTPVFFSAFLWKIVFRVGFGRPKCHGFVLLLALSYSLCFFDNALLVKVSNEACWLECQWRHCHIRIYRGMSFDVLRKLLGMQRLSCAHTLSMVPVCTDTRLRKYHSGRANSPALWFT